MPAIAEVAHARGACVMMDNTWATPLFFPPHAHGVDIAIEAGTKYLSGHSDLLLGLVSANADWFARVKHTSGQMAIPAGAGGCLSRRCAACARWSCGCARRSGRGSRWRAGSASVPKSCASSTPPCPTIPATRSGSATSSARRASSASILKPVSEAAVAAFLDGLELFGLGYSWGGYESLVIPFDCSTYRTATMWAPGGPALRFSDRPRGHRGLEGGPRPRLCAPEGDGLSAMRNFLIDTDTASDDAVAIIMALAAPDVRVLGLTTVAGNVGARTGDTQRAL